MLRLLILCCMFWSVSTQVAAQDSVDTESLIAAFPSNFPPQYSLDANGNPQGFAIEVMQAIAREAGLQISYQAYDNWTEAHQAIRNGQADLIPNMGITPDRRSFVDFSLPLETFVVSVFIRSDSVRLRSLQDLTGRPIGVVQTNVATRLLRDQGYQVIVYEDLPALLLDLISGQIDAMAYPEPTVWQIAQNAGLDHRIEPLHPPLVEVKRGVGIAKGQPELVQRLDQAIAEFVRSNEYETIYTRWYGKPSPFWNVARVMWATAALIAVMFLFFMFWRYYSLGMLNHNLESESRRRRDAEHELKQLNLELEATVRQRTAEVEHRNAILSCIDHLRANFIKESDPFILFPALLDQLLDLTQSEFGFIGDVLSDAETSCFLKLYALSNLAWDDASRSLYENSRRKGFEFRNLDNLLGTAVTSGQPVIANQPAQDPRRGGFPKGHPQLESFLGLPVYFGPRLVGSIGLANRFGGYDETLVQQLAPVTAALGQIIVARWDHEARQQAELELQRLANTDTLTGIANRRQFESVFAKAVARAKRYAEPLSLAMLDIDHFKQVNDQFGHDVGDDVLIEMVRQVQTHIREVDLLARWGGEEFMILLPQTSIETGQQLAERIRKNIAAFTFTNPSKITISLGLVSFAENDDTESMLQRVDAALYQAKYSGRNCVVVG